MFVTYFIGGDNMENIRATEIRDFKDRNFFGFSRFLVIVFAIATVIFTLSMVLVNNEETSPDKLQIWPSIVVFVLSGLMLIAFLLKKKYVQAILLLVFIIINILFVTRAIDLIGFNIKAKAYEEAHASSSSSAASTSQGPFSAFESIGKSFSNPHRLIKMILDLVISAYGIVYFIFNIKALVVRRAESINNAFRAKAEELRNNPEAAKGTSMKRIKKRTNKFARKEKYVQFCHELGVLCILDDPGYNDKYFIVGESKFKGSVIILGLLSLLWGFLNLITLGILIPWTTAWKEKYYAERTIYSGKRVKFDGKGIQLLGRWILWELLCIVTLGIYAFFMAIALKKWVIKHQHFEDETDAESEYTGTTFGRGLLVFGLKILQFITLGWATPYVCNRIAKYDMEHTVVSGHPLIFGGTAGKLLLRFMLWMLLCIVTFGVYAILVMPMNMTKYTVHYSRVRDMSYDPVSDPR